MVDDGLIVEWLRRIYEPNSRKLIYPVLMLDGRSSHVNGQFIDLCEPHNVDLFCLPPPSTHLLRPLDVRPLQRYNGIGIDQFFRLRPGIIASPSSGEGPQSRLPADGGGTSTEETPAEGPFSCLRRYQDQASGPC